MNGTPPVRAADAVTRGLVAVRLVLGTAELDVVVPVTVLPVAEVAAGRGAEIPVALRENKDDKVIVSSLEKDWCLFDVSFYFRYFALHIQLRKFQSVVVCFIRMASK